VLAIVGIFAWAFVAESLILNYFPGVGRYTPGTAGNAMTGTTTESSVHLLPAVAGGGVLAAYALAFVAAGALAVARRDVT
jgi:hypothetical protein